MSGKDKQNFPSQAPRDLQALLAQMGRDCVAFTLRKSARAITQVYDEHMRKCGLKVNQFSLMASICYGQPIKVGDLAAGVGMDRTTVTRNLGPLQRDGLVDVSPGEDKRERLVSLTPSGEERLRQAYPHWLAAQARLVEALGRENWNGLKNGLGTLRRASKSLAD